MDSYSIVIKGGKIVDGSGNPWFQGDVAVDGDRIAKVGALGKYEAEKVIDAEGLLVSPGFVDVHTHSDSSFIINPKADSKIRQGITTELAGNCGASMSPVTDLGKSFASRRLEELGIEWDWYSVAEYLARLEKGGMPVNLGTLIGHGTIRSSVMGYEARAPSASELEEMKGLVDQGMRDGAFGLSTGIKYAPGVYADTSEIVELSKVVAKHGGLYATHIRNQGGKLIESIDESIVIGREAGCPVHIAHLKVKGRTNWGKSLNMLRVIDEARDQGVDVTFDQYPYIASSTGLSALLPHWAQEGGADVLLERLRDPATREKIKDADWRTITTDLSSIMIARAKNNTQYEGMRVTEVAEKEGKEPRDAVFDLLLAEDAQVQIVAFGMSEEDVRRVMRSPYGMVGSDGRAVSPHGVLGGGKPHPRFYGTFPRVIGHYVREGVLSLQEAVRKMTSAPALRLGLKDRGLLREGYKADITVFDPAKVKDEATFIDPHQFASGIPYVIVNGTVVIDEGEHTGALPGVALKP